MDGVLRALPVPRCALSVKPPPHAQGPFHCPPVILAAAGIQNPDHAPRRLCQLRRAGCTGRRPPWTIPADPHQVGWEKGLWIPAAARMTDSLVKATREDENCLFIVIADGLARPRMRMKLAYFHNNDGAGGTAESYEVATHRFSLFWKYPSRTASAAIQLRLTTGHKHPGETGGRPYVTPLRAAPRRWSSGARLLPRTGGWTCSTVPSGPGRPRWES